MCMVECMVMDTHDKQLLANIAAMVEDNQRMLRVLTAGITSSPRTRPSDDRKAAKQAQIDALTPADRELFDTLRNWRRETTARGGYTSPMVVCQDATLLKIVAVRPTNEMAVRAVSAKFAEKYASEIIAIVRKHDGGAGVAATAEPW